MQKRKVELSIIILNYNTGDIFSKCVDSVLRATENLQSPHSELILLDNASTDNSFKVPKKERVIGIQNGSNLGFARGCNRGIREAKGKYVLLLNPDTVVIKDAIQKLLDFAKACPDAGAVGPKLLNPDGTTQPSAFYLPTLWGAIKEFWLGQKGIYSKYIPKKRSVESLVAVEALVMAAFLLTPRALKKVGFLNEKYFMYFEDLDYCRNLKSAGLKVYYLSEAEVIHYHGVSGKNVASQENQWRRLIPSSKIYHGTLTHNLINFVIWSGQKWQRVLDGR